MVNNVPSRASASLIEIIISICVFAVVGAITMNLFLGSKYVEKLSSDITIASMRAQNMAEYIKADIDELEDNTGITLVSRKDNVERYELYYNKEWKVVDSKGEYVLIVEVERQKKDIGTMVVGDIVVKKIDNYPFISNKRENLINLKISNYMR